MQNLEERLNTAKTFLNTELTYVKRGNSANLDRLEIDYHLDTIFEVERTGLRHIDDLQAVRLKRVLSSVEEVMGKISSN